MGKQLFAGLILEGVYRKLLTCYKKERIDSLFKHLSIFEINETDNTTVIPSDLDSLIAVYDNLLSRGIPTLSSISIEKYFSEKFNKTNAYKAGDEGYSKNKYKCSFTNTNLTQKEITLLFRALHIIDTILNGSEISDSYIGKMGQDEEGKYKFEHAFFTNLGAQYLGPEKAQLLDAQISFEAILRMAKDENGEIKRLISSSPDKFLEQEVDFAFEFPYQINKKKGVIIEIDGSQHEKDRGQKKLDELRDHAAFLSEWHTLRIPTSRFSNLNEALADLTPFFKDEYFQLLNQNYENPLSHSEEGKMALELIGGPLGVGRIQKVILREILRGNLSFEDDNWSIGIIERDLPLAQLAIEDLIINLESLITLEDKGRIIPNIELTIFRDIDKWVFERGSEVVLPLSEVGNYKGDILLDLSIWQRIGRTECPINEYVRNCITIRSSSVKKEKRKFHTDELVPYKSVIDIQDEDIEKIVFNPTKKAALEFLLQSIFRLKEFRPGQLRIVDMALQGKSVIGLLPTGGGKSLTYQICSLLQPGLSLIVDPIKSLMKDQNDGLLRNFIDAVTYINSSVKTAIDRERRMQKLCNGEVLFTFISPERLLVQSFRNKLNAMCHEKKTWFAYCIVDEAHCVSEWGHDFRTPYLRLAENVKRFCKLKDQTKNIPVFGLTATASYDVLADVKRELNLTDESVIRNRDNTRLELNYKVWRSETDLNENTTNEWEIKKKIGEAKYKVLDQILNEAPQTLSNIQLSTQKGIRKLVKTGELSDEVAELNIGKLIIPNYSESSYYQKDDNTAYNTGTLIFCPHKSAKIYSGVEAVKDRLHLRNDFDITTFYGTDDEEVAAEAEENQDKFINSESNLMAATKAFGMGIDKQNIRSTIHINYPSSIESLVQEAGRAGRDGHVAMCNVIISDQIQFDEEINLNFLNNSFKGEEKEKYIIWELLNEISFPIDSNAQSLSELLKAEFGLDHKLTIATYPKANPDRVYINTTYPLGFGCIFFRDYRILLKKDYDSGLSEKILKRAVDYLKKEVPSGMALDKWFSTQGAYRKFPGIEKLLLEMNDGDLMEGLAIGFRNNAIHTIYKNMVQLDNMITELMVASSLNFVTDADKFFLNLEKQYRNAYGKGFSSSTNKIKEKIQKLILKIRNEQDTFKAVYRLSILGIIDDYTVDYAKKCIYLTIKKISDDQMRVNLYNYLIRYLSKEKTLKELDVVDSLKGNSYLQKSMGFLMTFVYETIWERRIRGIKDVRILCENGEEKGGEAMALEIDLYFNAKYIKDLKVLTNEGKTYSENLIWDYVKEVKFSIDSLNHLRGSTTRILSDNPNNAALLILNAYAIICLEVKTVKGKLKIGSRRLINEALKDLAKGLAIYYQEKGDYWKVLNGLNQYFGEFNKELPLILEEAVPMIRAEVQQSWLKNFNEQFLKSRQGILN